MSNYVNLVGEQRIKQIIVLYVDISHLVNQNVLDSAVMELLDRYKEMFLKSLTDEIEEQIELVVLPANRTSVVVLTNIEIKNHE